MKPKNPAAVALGRLNAGKPKTMTAAALQQRQDASARAKAARDKRRKEKQ